MKNLTKLSLVVLLMFETAYAQGSELKEMLEGIFYWIAGIGLIISAGTIAAAKVWPDSWIEPLAQRYSKQLAWAVFGFLAFGIFKGQFAEFFAWLSNPTQGIIK